MWYPAREYRLAAYKIRDGSEAERGEMEKNHGIEIQQMIYDG